MKFMLSDEVQVEGYAKSSTSRPAPTWSTTSTSRPSRSSRTWPRRWRSAGRPYTLTFFEQINSPQGPWLQMLQRAYYTDERSRQDHRRREGADEGDRRAVTRGRRRLAYRTPSAAAAAALATERERPRPASSIDALAPFGGALNPREAGMHGATAGKLIGLLYLAPARALRARLHGLSAIADGLDVVPQLVADRAAEVDRARQFRQGLQRPPVLDVARLHPQIHALHHARS